MKPTVPVQPSTVSQLTSIAVLGVDPRRYLELVVPKCTQVSHVGRLRVVPIEDAIRALLLVAADATNDASPVAEDSPDVEVQPETADGFLAAIGRRRRRASGT